MPDGVEPIPDEVLLDPKWVLDLADGARASEQNGAPKISNGATDEEPPPSGLLDIRNGITAQITNNSRITPSTHWQDVRHLKLSAAGSHLYNPGDVLTIYPKNFRIDVSQFLQVTNWTSIADEPLRFIPSSPSTPPIAPLPLPNLANGSTFTLRELLTNHLDIMAIPRRSFFAQLAHYTSDEFHRERLLEFTNPEYIDELYDYTTRPRRSILEVLQEFESVKIPWQRVCSILPAMRGRQFSIASACNEVEVGAEENTEIELLIAIVKYKTVIKRIRRGVATRYIASLKPGQNITVTLTRGGLGVTEKEIERPIVMIGPGTGVAPMRSLIYQRMKWRKSTSEAHNDKGKDLLFFGCRNAEADYFFRDEWKELMDGGVPLDVFAAFSRDQVCPSHFRSCIAWSIHD